MEYTNSYINFLNYIVNFYDSGLTYDYEILNYKYIIEKNDTVDLYKLFSNFSNIKLTNKEWFEINNENKSFFLLTLGIYLLNADYSNSYLYNSMNNFNICWHEDIIKINENDVKIWLKWFNTSGDLYKYYEEEIKAKEQEIIENTRIIDNILQISLKNFMRFDSYTNINQLLLPSFFHYLNNNNIYNIQI
ncbi:hypothetical protein BCR36DRAFT_288711 [Piromyces finnis]|uniref:Uncharacterized protein n=1 Tax=Piromyces finnis TaxID=1754191 RepID=A0A1Y1VBK2_9FUNG|nr:hypothetical protein BCR36DRAFT_288711 [Piromyces finnis]|eukprot:ORX51093.1 hypothetical protein BCR36DRAFT_288711 [Piromyces finnis]